MAAEPGGGDGDAWHWLTFGRQLGQRIGLLVSGDACVSGYPVYHYLYHVGLEGERRITDQGGNFLPRATVETCRVGNGGLVVGKNVDVMPAQVLFIYLFIYFSLTLATLRLWRGLQN
jgi:hypothetical protein